MRDVVNLISKVPALGAEKRHEVSLTVVFAGIIGEKAQSPMKEMVVHSSPMYLEDHVTSPKDVKFIGYGFLFVTVK